MKSEAKTPAAVLVSLFVLVLALVAVIAVDSGPDGDRDPTSTTRPPPPELQAEDDGGEALEAAFRQRASAVGLHVRGHVKSLLPPDRDGAGEQRFLVELASGRTLLVVHDLELAQAAELAVGDQVEVAGEYTWSNRGGELRGTHRDPEGRRRGGFLRHAGRIYE